MFTFGRIPFNFPFLKKDGSISTIGDEINAGGGGGYVLPTASANKKGGVKIGAGLTMTGEVLSNDNPTPYSLPTAGAETLGGVKVGSNLSIDENGVLSASGGGSPYTLPTASAETKGGVKIGAGLTMTGEVLSNDNPTPYSLPTASDETLGGVKVGTGLKINDGVLAPDKTAYSPTLETGVSGELRFTKNADNGLITLVGAISLTTAMTTTRVKLASEIAESFRCGSDGYKFGSFFSVGVDGQGHFVPVDVRIFGSGNVWLYPYDTTKSVVSVYVSGDYYTDVYANT